MANPYIAEVDDIRSTGESVELRVTRLGGQIVVVEPKAQKAKPVGRRIPIRKKTEKREEKQKGKESEVEEENNKEQVEVENTDEDDDDDGEKGRRQQQEEGRAGMDVVRSALED